MKNVQINFIKVGSMGGRYRTSPLPQHPKSCVLWINRGQGPLCGKNFKWIYEAYISWVSRKKTLSITVKWWNRPYVDVSGSAASRWNKEALKLVGINVSIFRRQSTRVASSSKAIKEGFSLADILERGS